MKIKYTNNLEEIVEVNHLLLMDNPIVKKRINICRILLPMILMVFFFIFNLYSGFVFIILKCIYLLLAILLVAFYQKYYERKLYKVLYKQLGQSDILFKSVTLTLDGIGMYKEADGDTLSVPWSEIQNIQVINEHVVINLATNKFFAIPIRAFSNETEKNSFMQIVKEHIDSNKKDLI